MKKRFAAGEGVVETRWLVSEQICATKPFIGSPHIIPAVPEDAEVQWKIWIRGGSRDIGGSRVALRAQRPSERERQKREDDGFHGAPSRKVLDHQ